VIISNLKNDVNLKTMFSFLDIQYLIDYTIKAPVFDIALKSLLIVKAWL
jgi:hypothetical protein